MNQAAVIECEMNDLLDLIRPEGVASAVAAVSKKQLFQQLAQIAGTVYGVDADMVVERLVERERLGSTGFGGGVAIPHAKLDGLDHVVGVFAQLIQPIDFDAVDDEPVDLVFMLLSPTDGGAAHLKALARVSRSMRDGTFVAKLRGAASNDAIYALFAGEEARDAA